MMRSKFFDNVEPTDWRNAWIAGVVVGGPVRLGRQLERDLRIEETRLGSGTAGRGEQQ